MNELKIGTVHRCEINPSFTVQEIKETVELLVGGAIVKKDLPFIVGFREF
jgi:hypothetical protein